MAHVIARKELHCLVDETTPVQLAAAATLLRSMLPKPIEDEEITEAEKAAALAPTPIRYDRG